MDKIDTIVKEEDGQIYYAGWIEWKHLSGGLIHCWTCIKLNGCWFNSLKMPDRRQHEKCHCITEIISKPIENYNAFAKCDINKFTNYIFSEKYEWNGKRKLFEKLGFTIKDAEYLKSEYEKQAVTNYCNGNYQLDALDIYGQRINIVIKFERNGRSVEFESGWLVCSKGTIKNTTPLAN